MLAGSTRAAPPAPPAPGGATRAGARLSERLARALEHPEAPAGAAVDALLREARERRASDIHLDPDEDGLRIRLRIDGAIIEAARLPRAWQGRFVARVKVLADLLTYREDLAQEGRIAGHPAAGDAVLRVSVIPSLHGEKATLRVLPGSRVMPDLAELGFDEATQARLRTLSTRRSGMLLLTGPSGSGKTTTIYALLSELVRGTAQPRSVVTVEDPVEMALPGVVQTQVNRAAGLDFAGSLRALLRHDPEVLVIGEIRDRETADIAVEAGLTGHLVISTIHSGSAPGVFGRLLDIGIEPHAITSTVMAVLAQRLARRLCPDCRGVGVASCEACAGTGLRGRTVLYELAPMDGQLRRAILRRADESEMAAAIREQGCPALEECARKAVAAGVTSWEEARRVLA